MNGVRQLWPPETLVFVGRLVVSFSFSGTIRCSAGTGRWKFAWNRKVEIYMEPEGGKIHGIKDAAIHENGNVDLTPFD